MIITPRRSAAARLLPLLFLLSTGCISIATHEAQMRQCREESKQKKKAEDQAKIYRLRNERLQEQVVQSARERRALEKDLKKHETDLTDVRLTYDQLITDLKEELAEGTVEVSVPLEGYMNISVADKILFDSGEADLKRHGSDVLTSIGRSLATQKNHYVRVEGHTDNVPIRGELAKRFPTNWDLSAARASTIVRSLQAQGVAGDDLVLTAFSEFRPTDSNATESGRARNRRVEIWVGPKE
jgi:chemotaxis protein MotB